MFGFVFRLFGRIVGFAARVVIFGAALVAVAGAVAYALFDSEQYKAKLSQRVVDLSGRALQITGAAELQLTLPPRIVLHDVRLKNARWGTRPDMARVKRVDIELNPLAAVSGGNSVAQVRLEGADVLLETNQQGIGNWEMAGIAAGSVAVGALAFGLFNSNTPLAFSDTTVTFRDGATGRVQTAALGSSPITLGGGPIWPGLATGGAATGSWALAAANSDNTNPCDGSPQASGQSSAAPSSRPR